VKVRVTLIYTMKKYLVPIVVACVLCASFAQARVVDAQTPAPATPVYAALGDSEAAGLGLAPRPNPTATDTQCGRSSQSYSYMVAQKMKLPLLLAACSGATVGDLFTKQSVSGPNIPAQLTTAYASGTPRLITITAGANDLGWSNVLRTCYVTNCATKSETWFMASSRALMEAKLYTAFSSIYLRSNGTPPTVVITGYYNPLSASCSQLQSNVTSTELAWIADQTNALNQSIQNVSSHFSFVRFAPVDFTGHDICSGNSWVQGLTDPAPFHPTAAGQTVIAQSVLTSLGQ
jgi:lysophospholipase L1-like esterase